MDIQNFLHDYYSRRNPPRQVPIATSNEEIKAFFDSIIAPIFKKIETSVKPYVERVHVSQFVKICKIHIKEREGSLTFRVEIDLQYSCIRVYPQYEVTYGSIGIGGDRGAIGKDFPLDFKKVTKQEIEEEFHKAFTNKDKEYRERKLELKKMAEDGSWPRLLP